MPEIHIPQTLFSEIEKAIPLAASADDFVLQAIREKLSFEDHKREFFRLTDQNREAMKEKGLSEEGILTDFDTFRRKLNDSRG